VTVHRLLIGTYTQGDATGIYWATFNDKDGHLECMELAIESESPAFLCRIDNHVYAVNEAVEGGVSAFELRADTLRFINRQSSLGSLPCHITASRHWIAVANYESGSVAVFRRESDGAIGQKTSYVAHEGSGPVSDRQRCAHAHEVHLVSDTELMVPDLGADRVYHYRINPRGVLNIDPSTTSVKPGSGPRHIVAHPQQPLNYLLNELSNTIAVLNRNDVRHDQEFVSTLPEDYRGPSTTAEIQLSDDGRFIYASNRGHDSIVTMALDDRGLPCEPSWVPTHGEHPRFFCFDPTRKWLLAANQQSDNVAVYPVVDGRPTEVVRIAGVPTPTCLLFI
jgi:6-phosphogluconolactonase